MVGRLRYDVRERNTERDEWKETDKPKAKT